MWQRGSRRRTMNAPSTRDTDVLIVGAGATGLVLALWLARLGVRVRVVDKKAEPETTSRAVAVQARTLELYTQLGLAGAVVERGRKLVAANLWVAGKHKARFFFGDMGAGLSPFPYALVFPQDEHERLLTDRLAELGVEVEHRTELLGFEEAAGRVLARLKRPDGVPEACVAVYIAGCDGAHSTVRETLEIGFPGGAYAHLFYVADVEATGAAMNGEVHVALDATDFLAVFPLKAEKRARLVGTIGEESEHRHETLSWNDVSKRVIEWMPIDVERVNWFSTYRVHHRVADQFRKGRSFLLGDAAHIHSPAGGQGMNTGIGDAVNLAWKLAAVLAGRAPDSLLDTYETERIGFAKRLVATTDRVFSFATAEGRIAEIMRTRIVPVIFPRVVALEPVRNYIFRTVSQITLNYRGTPLSAGSAGHVHGGDRLPWVPNEGTDNFTSLSAMIWQAHVYGAARPELAKWCADHNLDLHVFPWKAQHGAAGLARDALYLLRPDTYLALADASGRPDAIDRYCAERGLGLAARSAAV